MGKVAHIYSKDYLQDKRLRRMMESEFPPVKVRLTSYELGLMRDAMKNLVGEPLIHMVRVSPAQYLSFGLLMVRKNHKGEDSNYSDWGMMIGGSCHWCFHGPDGFSLGTDDFGPEKERRDEHAKPFYSRLNKDSIVVESVEILEDGTQVLSFTDGFTLTIKMPKSVSRYSEPWRFMPPRDDFRGHLCLMEFGLKWGYRIRAKRNTRAARRQFRRKSINVRPGYRQAKRAWSRGNYLRALMGAQNDQKAG